MQSISSLLYVEQIGGNEIEKGNCHWFLYYVLHNLTRTTLDGEREGRSHIILYYIIYKLW